MMDMISDRKNDGHPFNKKEMFSNLKKKQDQHTILSKELNLVCARVQLKVLSSNGNGSDPLIEFLLFKKVS